MGQKLHNDTEEEDRYSSQERKESFQFSSRGSLLSGNKHESFIRMGNQCNKQTRKTWRGRFCKLSTTNAGKL
jgi:hypothetical protein